MKSDLLQAPDTTRLDRLDRSVAPRTRGVEQGIHCHDPRSIWDISDVTPQPLPRQSGFSAGRIVGILAFCHSLLFAVLWLMFCSMAGAASQPVETNLTLVPSAYAPSKARDPFVKLRARVVSSGVKAPVRVADESAFRLQGILYQPTNPSALINDQLVTVNRSFTIPSTRGELVVQVKSITRDVVILEVEGQTIELTLPSNQKM